MYQRDYLLRLIEQMTVMVGKIAGMRIENKQQQAFDTIDELLGRYFRLNSRLLNALSERDLIAMLTVNGFVETEKLHALSLLLKEEGDLFESLGQPEEAYRRHLKALHLQLAAVEEGPEGAASENRREMDSLLKRLKPYDLPFETKHRLFAYHERAGQFADAEDILFELLSEGGSQIRAEGEAFYTRLLAMDDERLEAGRLPRDEVAEGLDEIRREAAGE